MNRFAGLTPVAIQVRRTITSVDGKYANVRSWREELVRVASNGDLVCATGWLSMAAHVLPDGQTMTTKAWFVNPSTGVESPMDVFMGECAVFHADEVERIERANQRLAQVFG